MRLLFCKDPLVPTQVDPYLAFEASVAASLGIPCSLISFAIFRIYGGIPGYFSVYDAVDLLKAVLTAALVHKTILKSSYERHQLGERAFAVLRPPCHALRERNN